jgi:4-hydroxy 2-oxovalerate aldolase
MMAGIYKSHPNNIIYLTEKYRLDTKDIGHILSMINPETRQTYDYDNIEKLYTEYVADKINDSNTIEKLRGIIENREVLVLVPGNTLNTHRDVIDEYVRRNNPITISVNFVADDENAYAFFGNAKRYARQKGKRSGRNVIIASNIKPEGNDIVVNYHSLINRGYKYFENSTIMLMMLLKRITPSKISIAGFDGFNEDISDNYLDSSYQNDRHKGEFNTLNEELATMFEDIVLTMTPGCEFEFVTPSVFSRILDKVYKK